MNPASGIVLHFTRCNAAARTSEWNAWTLDQHLPAMSQIDGVRAATHWALTQQPVPGMPSVGFKAGRWSAAEPELGSGAAEGGGAREELVELSTEVPRGAPGLPGTVVVAPSGCGTADAVVPLQLAVAGATG